MGNCSCVYLSVDEYPEIQLARTIFAARPHECGECGKVIKKDEMFEMVNMKQEDIWSTHKTCNDCLCLRNEFFCDGWWYGLIHQNLSDHIYKIIRDGGVISSKCLERLAPKARAWVCEEMKEAMEEVLNE